MRSNRLIWVVGILVFVALAVVGAVYLATKSRTMTITDSGSNKNGIASNSTTTDTYGNSTDNSTTAQNSNTFPNEVEGISVSTTSLVSLDPVDPTTYNEKLLAIANLPIVTKDFRVSSTLPGSSTIVYHTIAVTSTLENGWPVTSAPIPNAGALLPYDRIVAYYGNLYSKQMGVLGEYPPDQMLAMLSSTTAQWAAADPSTPVIPALDYIAVAAQASPGPDGKYRLRMPDSQLDEIMSMAKQVNGLVFLDIQVGLSNVETEVPVFQKYLAMPNVELSLDPEFDMHDGEAPGTVIGTMDASDINWAANYLAQLVKQDNLPPKILVVHRFTDDMVTHTSEIQPLPEVQIVMDMDGFGFPAKKINTYEQVIVPYPVQFTGFKLFYKNDAAGPMGHLMTPEEVLKLSPQPSYIQYQ